MCVSDALSWLIHNSLANAELLRGMVAPPGQWNAKIDARIPSPTFEELKLNSTKLGISHSVYIRAVLYHFYITKRIYFVKKEGHYTLAERHE